MSNKVQITFLQQENAYDLDCEDTRVVNSLLIKTVHLSVEAHR
jgi:hypothetical protein